MASVVKDATIVGGAGHPRGRKSFIYIVTGQLQMQLGRCNYLSLEDEMMCFTLHHPNVG